MHSSTGEGEGERQCLPIDVSALSALIRSAPSIDLGEGEGEGKGEG